MNLTQIQSVRRRYSEICQPLRDALLNRLDQYQNALYPQEGPPRENTDDACEGNWDE